MQVIAADQKRPSSWTSLGVPGYCADVGAVELVGAVDPAQAAAAVGRAR